MPRVDLPLDIYSVRDHVYTPINEVRYRIDSEVSFAIRAWRVQVRMERVWFALRDMRTQLGGNQRGWPRRDVMEDHWND
jgi:hypothetical protein